uniref:Deoxyhypusine synthase n=1 Tax=Heterorhabditis bacteriophora TaxID=37862 RepID=A0A1I7WYX9_HETBA
MSKNDFIGEVTLASRALNLPQLRSIANAIVSPGKGILGRHRLLCILCVVERIRGSITETVLSYCYRD